MIEPLLEELLELFDGFGGAGLAPLTFAQTALLCILLSKYGETPATSLSQV